MRRRLYRTLVLLACTAVLLTGCQPSRPVYLFDDGDMSHYKGVATEIEYPDVDLPSLAEVDGALPPLTLRNPDVQEIWDLPLEEAVQIALANGKVLKQLGGQLLPANSPGRQVAPETILSNPSFISSIYQPAIVETNPRRGVEAALAQFDAQFSTSMFWERNDRPVNLDTGGVGGFIFAPVLEQDLGTFQAQISKTNATGGTVAFRQNTRYEFNNNPTRLFPSDWNVNFEAEFRQPLLQGAGVQFNRIAGPNAAIGFNQFGNGVMIARIQMDIALVDFEANVRDLVADVERTYWELYYAYRYLDAVIVGRDSALQTWRKIYASFIVGIRGGEAEKEAQAREQYFLFRSQVENALSNLYAIENRLRYMLGLSPTDGRLIRPSDEPTTAQLTFDWFEVHAESLARTPELRRQKWAVKQAELELIATRNFLLPRLDAVGRYRWLGLGDDLINPNSTGGTFDNAFQNLTDGDFQEWQLGLQMNMAIGFRQAIVGVRNAQLQIARDRAVLQDAELEVSHQIADALRDLERFYVLSQTNLNRRVAAQRQVEAVRAAYETETVTLDLLLDAQRRLADAESAYYRSLVDYNLSVQNIHYRKGSLLEYNGVYLAEGPWPGKAYFDARKRARERDSALFVNYGFTLPRVISRGPVAQDYETTGETIYEEVPSSQSTEPLPTPAGQQPGVLDSTSLRPAAARPAMAGPVQAGQPAVSFAWGNLGMANNKTPGAPVVQPVVHGQMPAPLGQQRLPQVTGTHEATAAH